MAIEKPRQCFALAVQVKAVFKIQTFEIASAKACNKEIIEKEGAHLAAILGKPHTLHDTKVVDVASLAGLRITKAICYKSHAEHPVHVATKLLIVHAVCRIESQSLQDEAQTLEQLREKNMHLRERAQILRVARPE